LIVTGGVLPSLVEPMRVRVASGAIGARAGPWSADRHPDANYGAHDEEDQTASQDPACHETSIPPGRRAPT
jgi:hypothetical protein